jgi:hypothetical protein
MSRFFARGTTRAEAWLVVVVGIGVAAVLVALRGFRQRVGAQCEAEPSLM